MSVSEPSFGFEVERKGQTVGLIHQVHGATIVEAGEGPAVDADGVFTEKSGKTIFIFTADCLPVLFVSDRKVAAIHAGWRGAKLGIVRKTLELFAKDGLLPKVILGPCLRNCCFEVKTDFIEEVSAERGDLSPFLEDRAGKKYFDLVSFVRDRELSGLSPELIDITQARCTYCSKPTLPSYRRNRATDPRIKAWITGSVPQ